jgi:uncharacterized repeat protein (TIGR03803 family)
MHTWNRCSARGAGSLSLLLVLLTACGGDGGSQTATLPPTYTVGGTVTGLSMGDSVVLSNNGGDATTIKANGTFTFPTPIASGGQYAVTVTTLPINETCVVSGGKGTIASANLTSVSISCAPKTYTIGGTVTGLAAGTSITLQDNGGEAINVSSNANFTFPTALTIGAQYNVTISKQPAYQGCSVVAGSDQVVSTNITNIQIRCPVFTLIDNLGFGSDGSYPQSGLIVGSDGNFYGTTEYGGLTDNGTVYRLAASGTESIVANFAGGAVSHGPVGALLQASDGNFYGTTYWGGTNNTGSVFKLALDGTITTLWSFGSGTDGELPESGLTQASDGNLYGTTGSGGITGYGTVFRVTLSGVETVLWNFGTGTDGYAPQGALVMGSDGNLYGTTSVGGLNDRGTIFRITLFGVETVVWSFGGTVEGSLPAPTLIVGSDGDFYGTTEVGGANGGGTLFKFTPAGALSIVWAFGVGTDGSGPRSGVTQGTDGNFYGTTVTGGTIQTCGVSYDYGCGTIFRVTPSGEETVLWDFGFGGNGTQVSPLSVVQSADGSLLGVTSSGGSAAGGSIYQLTL